MNDWTNNEWMDGWMDGVADGRTNEEYTCKTEIGLPDRLRILSCERWERESPTIFIWLSAKLRSFKLVRFDIPCK